MLSDLQQMKQLFQQALEQELQQLHFEYYYQKQLRFEYFRKRQLHFRVWKHLKRL